jgi:hypothetical protein
MRRLASAAASLTGVLVASLVFALWLGLWLGGISYQKTCLTNDGRVAKEWDFQWLTPIPYVFRPSGEGCTVHTGTRVALAQLGLFGYDEPTAEAIAEDTADEITDPTAAYWARLKGIVATYLIKAQQTDDPVEARRLYITGTEKLESLTPPARFATGHGELVGATQAAVGALTELVDQGATRRVVKHWETVRAQYTLAIEDLNQAWESYQGG